MARPLSSYRADIQALGPGAQPVHIRVSRDQGPALDRFLLTCRGSRSCVATSRTGSKSGQHAIVWVLDPDWVRRQLAGVRGLEVWVG